MPCLDCPVAYLLDGVNRRRTEPLCEICCHHHTRVRCDTQQRDHTDPNRDRKVDRADVEEVLHVGAEDLEMEEPRAAVEPNEDESARYAEDDTRVNDQRRHDAAELEIEQ